MAGEYTDFARRAGSGEGPGGRARRAPRRAASRPV